MGDEKVGKTLACLVAREKATRAVLSTVVPRKSMGHWICRRLMAWFGEIRLEFVDILMKSDNEPALTSLRAMNVENSEQVMIRTMRSAKKKTGR